MATQYTINLTMPQPTVAQLVAGKYSLYGFKAVQSASPGGVPLVWFKTQIYLESNQLTWTEQYSAYLAESVALTQGTQISASTSVGIGLQQEVTATATGLSTPVESQTPGITIINNSTEAFTCGLMLQPPSGSGGGSSPTPLCAFSLPPSMVDEMVPIEQVVLLFATDEVNTGTVFEQSTSWAVLIDLTQSNTVSVNYDLTQLGGWTTAPNVTPQQPPVNLVSIVVPAAAGTTAGPQ